MIKAQKTWLVNVVAPAGAFASRAEQGRLAKNDFVVSPLRYTAQSAWKTACAMSIGSRKE